MSVKLVMLKSGEDLIADVKEIKSKLHIIILYFCTYFNNKHLMLRSRRRRMLDSEH